MPQFKINAPVLRNAVGRIVLAVALISPALAQNLVHSETPAAASGPAFDASVGYSYLGMQLPGSGTENLGGIDASAGIHFFRHWGAIIDSSYVRGSDVFVAQHDTYVLSALAGPVFYPAEWHGTWLSIRALGGAGLVDSAVPVTGQSYTYLHEWLLVPPTARA